MNPIQKNLQKSKEEEVFDPKKEIEKLCEENKIFFTGNGTTHEDLIAVGLGNLLYNQLTYFVNNEKVKGFHILKVRNPETKQEYYVEIKCENENFKSEEVKKQEISSESLELLNNPNLLEIIDKELDKKVVGEHEARKTIFMVSNMRNVENLGKATDNLMVNAISGTGKDYIVEAIFDLIPLLEKEELIRTTPKVLAYTRNKIIDPDSSWKKVSLRLEDCSNEVLNDDSFKVFSSANPNKTNKGKTINKGKVIDIQIEGKPSIIMTIASANPREELLRRFPICPLDEGINQTKEILKRQSEFAKTGRVIEYDFNIVNALSFLKRIKVKIPYADLLIPIFNPQNVIIRTHYPRFLDYIKSSCSLYQYQRQSDNEGYYIATEQDYNNARMMLSKTTSNVLMIPLDKIKRTILEAFEKQNLQRKSVDDLQEISEIEKLNISPEWLRKQLDWLSSKTFLIKDKEKRKDEADRIIPKPIFIYSYNPIQKLEIPEWKEISSNTYNSKNTQNSSNTYNTRVNEVNEVIDLELEKQHPLKLQENNWEDSLFK